MLKFLTKSRDVVAESDALPGRDEAIAVPARHTVLGTPLLPPFPEGIEVVQLGLGCFWGAERLFWQLPGVYTTAVGYAGGYTKNPTLRRGLLRPHRPHRGRARRLRPEGAALRAAPEDVLGGPRPDAGHAPGQRHGHPVPLGALLDDRRAARGALRSRDAYQAALERARPRPDHDRAAPRPARSTRPRTTTSSTCRRTRAATAASAARASPARSAPASAASQARASASGGLTAEVQAARRGQTPRVRSDPMRAQTLTRPPLAAPARRPARSRARRSPAAGVHATAVWIAGARRGQEALHAAHARDGRERRSTGAPSAQARRVELGVEHAVDARAVADHVELVGALRDPARCHTTWTVATAPRSSSSVSASTSSISLPAGRSAPASGTFAPVAETRTAGPAIACTRSMPWLARSST